VKYEISPAETNMCSVQSLYQLGEQLTNWH